jgi:hypothetical protein
LKFEDTASVLLADREDAETRGIILRLAPEPTAKHDKPASNKSKPATTFFFILTIEAYRQLAFKASVNGPHEQSARIHDCDRSQSRLHFLRAL